MYTAIHIEKLRATTGRWAVLNIESGEVIAAGESHAAAEAAADALSSLTAAPSPAEQAQSSLGLLGIPNHKDLG